MTQRALEEALANAMAKLEGAASRSRPPRRAARSSFAISAAITSLSEVERSVTPSACNSLAQRRLVDEIAVVPERNRAGAAVLHERLRVRPLRRARRRVARVADRDFAAQPVQLLLVEDLRHQTEVSQCREPPLLGDGDAGRLLAAVLQGEEAEVRQPRDVAFRSMHAEDAAHLADPSDLDEAARAKARNLVGEVARIAAPRAGSSGSSDSAS